jgi:hypothetical protein
MKGIYDVRCVRDIYQIVKRHYDFNIRNFKIADVPLSVFHHFRRDLQESSNSYLNFAFAYTYADTCKHSYHITCVGTEINLYVLMDAKITPKIKKQFFKNLYRVCLITAIYGISKPFNFYIIMNPLKRCMPSKKDDDIDVVNVNGGYTYINRDNIYIIRKEDYGKVMLHELLHHNTTMHHQDWDASNIRRLKEHFKIHEEMLLLPNEAIIETFACILNTIFYSIETTNGVVMPSNGVDTASNSLSENLKRDQEHSLCLAKRIIDKQDGRDGGVWNEKTHSFCYIVFKTILYVYVNQFLKIYRYQNDTAITDFLLQYSPKIYRRLRRMRRDKRTDLKQTIYEE